MEREEENRAKEEVILHVDELPLYFLFFLLVFSQDRLTILFQLYF